MVDSRQSKKPAVLTTVALLVALREQKLGRGQVGTVVDTLDHDAVLVEFSDDDGRAYAVTACPRSSLLVLHYEPEAA